MFNIQDAKPGDTWSRCINVTHGGSLDADVHLYLKDSTGTLGPHLTMRMRQGSRAGSVFPSCVGFTPGASAGGSGIVWEAPNH